MLDIQNLTYENIIEQSRWQGLEEELKRIIINNDTKTAYRLAREMEKKIHGIRDVDRRYLRYLATLQWVAFSLLREIDVLHLVEFYFDVPLETDIDPLEKLKLYLIMLPITEEEEVKEKIAKLLERSTIKISSEKITLVDQPEQEPIIKNWLIDYRLSVMDKPQDKLSLARSEYFSGNKNFLSVDEASKVKLKILFDYYEFLKTLGVFSGAYTHDVILRWPDDSLSIIDDTGMYKIYEPPEGARLSRITEPLGEVQKTSQNLPETQKSSDEIYRAYHGDLAMEEKMKALENLLEKNFQNNPAGLRQEFFSAVQKIDVYQTIAVLRQLIVKDGLVPLLEQDEKLKAFLGVVLEKELGKPAVTEFQKRPGAPQYVRYFLQYVLQSRLGLPEGEAARYGAQLGNLFKKMKKPEYSHLAYFDLEKKAFRWMEES